MGMLLHRSLMEVANSVKAEPVVEKVAENPVKVEAKAKTEKAKPRAKKK